MVNLNNVKKQIQFYEKVFLPLAEEFERKSTAQIFMYCDKKDKTLQNALDLSNNLFSHLNAKLSISISVLINSIDNIDKLSNNELEEIRELLKQELNEISID